MRQRQQWTEVGSVESDTQRGTVYTIKMRSGDDLLGCSCMAYRFAKGEKRCKHTDAYAESQGLQPVSGRVRREVEPIHRVVTKVVTGVVTVKTTTETFTVRPRRGIVLSGGMG